MSDGNPGDRRNLVMHFNILGSKNFDPPNAGLPRGGSSTIIPLERKHCTDMSVCRRWNPGTSLFLSISMEL